MSIKQNGGVFGRNPTFNDVTIEGQLTFDGDIDINSDLKIDGNLIVDGTSTLDGATSVTGGNFYVSNGSVSTAGVLVDANGATLSFTRNTTSYIRNNAAGGQLTFTTNGNSAASVLNLGTTGNVTVGTGNLVIGTSGKGIDFSATAGTGTSELLDDYEEGTWTPANATWGNLTIAKAQYTKIGNTVHLFAQVTADSSATIAIDSSSLISGIPFAPDSSSPMGLGGVIQYYGSHGGSTNALADIVINGTNIDTEVIVMRGAFTYSECVSITVNLTYKTTS